MRTARGVAAVVALLAGLAWASVASGHTGWVFNCTDESMRVYVDGREVCHVGGDQMCTLELPAGRYSVRAELSDGRYTERTFDIPKDTIHFRTPCPEDDIFESDPGDDD